jgi:hypothetical protein
MELLTVFVIMFAAVVLFIFCYWLYPRVRE